MQSPYAFAADVHLGRDEKERAAEFARFIRDSAEKFKTLVLAGDVFHLWLGPSFLSYDNYRQVFEAFRERASRGGKTIIVSGNRDFLLDGETVKKFGAVLETEAAVVSHAGKTVLALHGDLLCGRDRRYQFYRRLVRMNALCRFARALPPSVAYGLGSLMQAGSKVEKSIKNRASMDIDNATAAMFFKGRDPRLPGIIRRLAPPCGFDAIVSGHVHAERISTCTHNGKPRTLVTLPTWTADNPGVSWDGEEFNVLGK
ncbi:MAG: UDP-2,3-diacylglucosamine diphosphatase [Planctomycetota bacterium]|jgi:UDP-2,3-diacylglucosamine hydrolase